MVPLWGQRLKRRVPSATYLEVRGAGGGSATYLEVRGDQDHSQVYFLLTPSTAYTHTTWTA